MLCHWVIFCFAPQGLVTMTVGWTNSPPPSQAGLGHSFQSRVPTPSAV